MRIAYVANHNQAHSNDDEGAIAYALRRLGCEVKCYTENISYNETPQVKGDFVLCHHWSNFKAMDALRVPLVFWYFDRITLPDPTLEMRSKVRRQWIEQITNRCAVGFCTDGDWVDQDQSGKLRWLMQGADERAVGRGRSYAAPPLLFAGARGHGTFREEQFSRLIAKYGNSLRLIEGNKRVYRREFADAIASAKIVLGPAAPVTDRYWSNRLYMVLGFGGLLLHAYSKGVAEHYADGKEVVLYHDAADLDAKIAMYSAKKELRTAVSEAGLAATIAKHTYRHRCEQLLKTVQEQLSG